MFTVIILPLRKFPIGIPIGKIPIRIWDLKFQFLGIFPIGIPIGKIPIGIYAGSEWVN